MPDKMPDGTPCRAFSLFARCSSAGKQFHCLQLFGGDFPHVELARDVRVGMTQLALDVLVYYAKLVSLHRRTTAEHVVRDASDPRFRRGGFENAV